MPSVIAVAAAQVVNLTSKTSAIPYTLTNFGACVDIWAPGDLIEAGYPGSPSATAVYGGTAQAAAAVAGLAATALERFPKANATFIASYLQNASSTAFLMYSTVSTVDYIAQQYVA